MKLSFCTHQSFVRCAKWQRPSLIVGAILWGWVSLFQGCSLDVPYENRYADPNAIVDAQSARELLATAYTNLPLEHFTFSVLSDDFRPTYKLRSNPSLQKLASFDADELTTLGNDLWARYYSTIAVANTVQERVDSLPKSQELQDIALESQRIKAYAYFQLLRAFAPIPTSASDSAGIIFKERLQMTASPRLSVGESIDSIRHILEHSTPLASFSAPNLANTSATSRQQHWFTPLAAAYLRAELELYAGDYAAAERWARLVITQKVGTASLQREVYQQLWQGNQCEARIFAPYINRYFYTEIVYDRQTGDCFTVNPTVLSRFGQTDLRRNASVFDKKLPDSPLGQMKNCFGKYNAVNWSRTNGGNSGETHYVSLYRTAGAYFILAEALAHQGKSTEAIATMNDYLGQREATLLASNLEGDALLSAILQEKQLEFLGEGERFFDLKRYRQTLLRNWTKGLSHKALISPNDYRWNLPIPKGEYLYNDRASQNFGWPRLRLGE